MVIFIYMLHTISFFPQETTSLTAIDDCLTESTILQTYLCIYLRVLCVHLYVFIYLSSLFNSGLVSCLLHVIKSLLRK